MHINQIQCLCIINYINRHNMNEQVIVMTYNRWIMSVLKVSVTVLSFLKKANPLILGVAFDPVWRGMFEN